MEQRTRFADNPDDDRIMELVIQGEPEALDAFESEFDRGSVGTGLESWVYSLGAIYDVVVVKFELAE